MQVRKTKKSDTSVLLNISAGEAYLGDIKQRTLQRLAKQVKVAGFREGHVPLNLVEKHVDSKVLQSEFLDSAMSQLYSSALTKEQLHPVAQPKVNLKKFVPFSELEFEAELEVLGEVKLPDYTKIKVDKTPVNVTAKDIDDVLQALVKRAAERKEVKRTAAKNDQVTIDFNGVDAKDEAIKGADGKDYPLLLGSNAFIPGFENNLIGLKPGETKTFALTFPKDYGVKALANKKVTFTAKITKVEELIVPKVDDKFAASVGPFKTLEELRIDIKNQLLTERTQQAQHQMEETLIREITGKSKLSLPVALIEEQMEHDLTALKQNLAYRGQTYQEFLDSEVTTEEKYRQEVLRPQAEEKVKAGLVLSEISAKENLTVTPEELEMRIEALKAQYQDPATRAELDKPESRRSIASRLLTEKTLAKLRQYAI